MRPAADRARSFVRFEARSACSETTGAVELDADEATRCRSRCRRRLAAAAAAERGDDRGGRVVRGDGDTGVASRQARLRGNVLKQVADAPAGFGHLGRKQRASGARAAR